MLADVRFALRLFARNPLFTAAVVLVLGLGIGASTTVFSLVDAYLLKPLPFREPDRIVSLWSTRTLEFDDRSAMSVPDIVDLSEQSQSLSHLTALGFANFNLAADARTGGAPESVEASRVGASFFSLFGVEPALGRAFTPDEDKEGRGQVAVLSDALWRRRFGADPGAVGRTVTLDGKPYQVVGVMPPAFRVPVTLWTPRSPDLWVPAAFSSEALAHRDRHSWNVLGRLAPGASFEAADAEVRGIAKRLEQAYPASNAKKAFYLVRLQDHLVGPVRASLTTLFVATLLLLVIASANVALLLLARATAREGEVSVRAALGATGSRLLRQLLVESALLALFGGAVGFALSFAGTSLVAAGFRTAAYASHALLPDLRVLAFALFLSSLAGLGFGLVPAVRASRARLYDLLKEGASRSTAGGKGRRLQGALLVAEVALSAVLLAGSAAVARGFYTTLRVPLGFSTDSTLSFALHLPSGRYAEAGAARRLHEGLNERLRALPSVKTVGMASSLPLTGDYSVGGVEVEGRPPSPKDDEPTIQYQLVDPGYFGALGITLRRGRLLAEADREGSAPVMLVSEAFARAHFANGDAVGKRVRPTMVDKQWREIVGVVGDVRDSALEATPKSIIYVPYAQMLERDPFAHVSYVVRTGAEPHAIANAARDALRQLDAELALVDVKSFDERASESLADRRFTLVLVAAFALSALLLTALGLFGLVSYQTRRRSRELAIRMALGAAANDVQRLVVRDTSRLLLAGLALGLPAAFLAGRLLASKLEGVPAADPLSLIATALLLGLVALAAVLAPARRAARTPPALVLRDE
ncbi:MAG TPA: ABC transporter permease [Polyangiaceae bacterium]|nr:ABC transporter permease [Polyangiaceae bacterium]